MIEKGRHLKIEKSERLCHFCKNEIEDEKHFLTKCPLYSPERIILHSVCTQNYPRYENLNEYQKFIFLMSNENENIIKALAKFVCNSFDLREKIIAYFFEN